ncbi:MAG: hypothetical protein H0U49_09990 [Parachlamydiaceae bacterium]|nr:hypothetical protein [Parachlamydiaceae bacterium]
MTFEIIKAIFDVAKNLLGMKTELEKANREKRDRVSAYFADIGKLIEEVSASLKLKQYPHGSCAQLEDLANLMPKTLKGLLPEETILENYQKLYEVRKIEILFGQISHLKESEIPGKLTQLDEAAGKFKALATHLKVSSKDE